MPIVAPVTKTRRDRDVGRVDRRRAATPRAAAAQTPHRGPTFVDIPLDAFGPASVEIPAVDRAALRGATPDPDAVQRVADARRRVGAAGAVRRRRRVLGPRRRTRCVAFAEAARVPGVRQRHGPRHAPGRPRARVLARPVGRAEGSRPRARRGDAARLPARVRPVRRRAGRAPVRRRDRGRRRTPTSRRRRRATCSPRSPSSPDAGAPPGAHDDWIAQLRADEQAKRAAEAAVARRRSHADHARRASTASCASGSTATRS